MLSEKEYFLIKERYLKEYPNHKELTNENTYFDTQDLYLTNHHTVLRLRKINNSNSELTLKIQKENGCLEINHPLTLNEENDLLEKMVIEDDEILKALKENRVELTKLNLITTLKTERIEIEFTDYLFVLDKNYYRGKIDYNLEVESTSEILAKQRLLEIIKPFGIKYKKDYISKSKRAIYNL